MQGTESYPPIRGLFGAFSWGIAWNLTSNSDNKKGGYIIQHVRWTILGKKMTSIMSQVAPNVESDYYEAWRVPPGTDSPADKIDPPIATKFIDLANSLANMKGQSPENQAFLTFYKQELKAQEEAFAASKRVIHDIFGLTPVLIGKSIKILGSASIDGEAWYFDCLTPKDIAVAGFGDNKKVPMKLPSLINEDMFQEVDNSPKTGEVAMYLLRQRASSVSAVSYARD